MILSGHGWLFSICILDFSVTARTQHTTSSARCWRSLKSPTIRGVSLCSSKPSIKTAKVSTHLQLFSLSGHMCVLSALFSIWSYVRIIHSPLRLIVCACSPLSLPSDHMRVLSALLSVWSYARVCYPLIPVISILVVVFSSTCDATIWCFSWLFTPVGSLNKSIQERF